ncbi:MAG: Gfo/Idh/MocA family oxidoreductase [Kiritimatiellia bacterium]
MTSSGKPLTLAGCGCGSRTRTYMSLAAEMPDKYRIVAGSDPVPERVAAVRDLSGNPGFQSFSSFDELLARPRLADVLIIGTQDADHYKPAKRAMELGYHLLLEKPAATTLEDVLDLERIATERQRRVLLGFVLRYTNFYRKVRGLIESGRLGKVVTFNLNEGAGAWHQVHSFVRGHWSRSATSTPMILAKCSHDLDLMVWLFGARCAAVNSYGRLSHFHSGNAPAGAPARCTDGCPVGDTCDYNARLYTGKHKGWLSMVMDGWKTVTDDRIIDWLRTSPWGRCAYRCDNDVPDHQVLAMDFEGGITGTFTMTAFDEGRHLEIHGTKAVLKGGESLRKLTGSDLALIPHNGDAIERFDTRAEEKGYKGHGGGDQGLMEALYEEMSRPDSAAMTSSIQQSVESHYMGFAAEISRRENRAVRLSELRKG